MATSPFSRDAEADPAQFALLEHWRVQDRVRGWHNWRQLSERVGTDWLPALIEALNAYLPGCADADMALNNLERFLAAAGIEPHRPQLLDPHLGLLDVLIQLFSTSQYLSDLLITDPGLVPMLLVPLRQSPTRAELLAELSAALAQGSEDAATLRALRSFRQRHLLRIGTNDVVRNRTLEEVTRDISLLAEVAVEAALQQALQTVARRFGEPRHDDGSPARCVVLAFGKLGGQELNYSSDIDLMVIYDEEGNTSGRPTLSLVEFYSRVIHEMVRLLTAYPPAYRVDLRLRPEGKQGPLARTFASTRSYYETLGRTWERQALIKLRPIAGDLTLGWQFLAEMQPWVYRKYLGFAEINEIKALKRRIEQQASREGVSDVEVKKGLGGIRDVEFTLQFLQLLNGSLETVQQRSTLAAIEALAQAGCLTDQESRILENGYRFLRKLEHRLQLMFDLQTHRLPSSPGERTKLAQRMGYGMDPTLALERFNADYQEKTTLNRRILDHLLHDTFTSDAGQSEPEADMILIPDLEPATIAAILQPYGFRNVDLAYQNLMQLAKESVPFLHNRRCRQFLANIASRLLKALAETPDPDLALTHLEKVTASLGAKGILWELFSFNPPSLKLYVDLCSGSPFFVQLLMNNPGMIDELLDSLVLNRPRTRAEMAEELTDLCHNADDPDRILHSFRDVELLRIGTFDLLGKEPLRVTLQALTDLAETLLVWVADHEFRRLADRWGEPSSHLLSPLEGLDTLTWPCRYVLLGLGKLGGREMSYSSDLDLILVYEEDGQTHGGQETTDNYHFFSELARQIIKRLSQHGPHGRLYNVDMRLRPTGKSGSLVIPLAEFMRYYQGGSGQLWERLALTRARVVHGEPEFAKAVLQAVHQAVQTPDWRPCDVDEIVAMRKRLEASRGERDFKRGFGGIVDIEFIVQLFQLKYGKSHPAIRQSNLWDALERLAEEGLMSALLARELAFHYEFLRRVESKLRIVNLLAQDDLPRDPQEMEKLARRLGHEASLDQSAAESFWSEMEHHTTCIRRHFNELCAQERRSPPVPRGSGTPRWQDWPGITPPRGET